MSNFLAIATVTATLSQLLRDAVQRDVPGADVTMLSPHTPNDATPTVRVNLFLYQVTPHGAWRNADVPTRSAEGRLLQRPQAALALHYLLTFYGNEAQLEPQRLLGSVVRTLHARPQLSRQKIQQVIAQAPFNTFLATSNLADAVEVVKFAPTVLSLEEMTKLWAVFSQTPYSLSVAYEGSVVLIDSDETPAPTLPVQQRQVYVAPLAQPVIMQVKALAGPDYPLVVGETLVLHGQRLQGALTRVLLSGQEVTPAQVSDTQLRLPLTVPPLAANALQAGVQSVQVVHQLPLGMPPTPHRGVESNVAAFVLHPTLSSVTASAVHGTGTAPRSADITLQVAPALGSAQRVSLSLYEQASPTPAAYRFVAAPRATATTTLTVPVQGVRTATYLVRVQVDGAESPLSVDTNPASPTFQQYIGPRVTIP